MRLELDSVVFRKGIFNKHSIIFFFSSARSFICFVCY